MKAILQYTCRCTHVLMVLIILTCLFHLLQTITLETLRLCTPRPTQNSNLSRPDPARRYIRLLPDGTPHQIHHTAEKDPNTGHRVVEIYDANNTFVTRSTNLDGPDSPYLLFPSRITQSYSARRVYGEYGITPGFSATLDVPVIEGDSLQEIWRYDRGDEVFRGYDRAGKGLGYLDKDGWGRDAKNCKGLGRLIGLLPQWTSEKGSPILLWRTRNSLYEIDVKARSVATLADSSNSPISAVSTQAWFTPGKKDKDYRDPNQYRPLIVCRTEHAYHLALREPNQLITFSVPEDWRTYYGAHCRFSATRTDLFMLRSWIEFRPQPSAHTSRESLDQWIREFRSTKKRHRTELYRMDAQGGLEKLNTFSWMETQVRGGLQLRQPAWTCDRVVRCGSPGLYTQIPSILGRQRLEAYYFARRQTSGPSLWSILMLSPQGTWDYLPSSLILTLVVFVHGRSGWTRKGHAAVWAALVLLLNLVGFLTYLAFNHTAAVKCPHCGKRRGLSTDACPRCGAPLPHPVHSRPQLIMNQAQIGEASA